MTCPYSMAKPSYRSDQRLIFPLNSAISNTCWKRTCNLWDGLAARTWLHQKYACEEPSYNPLRWCVPQIFRNVDVRSIKDHRNGVYKRRKPPNQIAPKPETEWRADGLICNLAINSIDTGHTSSNSGRSCRAREKDRYETCIHHCNVNKNNDAL